MLKREFIKYSLAGAGGIVASRSPIWALALNPDKIQDRNTMENKIEARYVIDTPKGLRCLICPNECTLKEGELSECKNRQVIDGKLYSLGYSNPCAIHATRSRRNPLCTTGRG